jgi:DNA modification methylase
MLYLPRVSPVWLLLIAHQTRKGRPIKRRWNCPGQVRFHPTQKPLGLMRERVADFSEPGELVCDPYAGSGTTGIACAQLGRRFLGWKRDAAMAALAQRRLAGLRVVPAPGQIEMFG